MLAFGCVGPIVNLQDVKQSHTLLKMFCMQFEKRYGSQYLVPNMHMMLHLKDCVVEFGICILVLWF